MNTEVCKRDFFGIINSMTWDEIRAKYGKLEVAQPKQEPLFIVKERLTGNVLKIQRLEYLRNKHLYKYISKDI